MKNCDKKRDRCHLPCLEVIKTCDGSSVKLEVQACPCDLIFWQESLNKCDWCNIPGAIGSIYSFIATLDNSKKYYRAVKCIKNKKSYKKDKKFLYSGFTLVIVFPDQSLIIDNGNPIAGTSVQAPTQLLWLNKFTPNAYPFILEEVQVYFASSVGSTVNTNVIVGDLIDIYIWEVPTAAFDPSVGPSVFKGSLTGQTVQQLNTFNKYLLTSPIKFDQILTDIVIAIVYRTPNDGLQHTPAIYANNLTGRSWSTTSLEQPIGNPPTLQGLILTNLSVGTYMIRGFGCGPNETKCLLE